jgi:CheY-like chemotaxis protein
VDQEFKILIAERNRHVREFLRRELVAEGYQVSVARDGREVLVLVNSEVRPDLLILDLEIPYLSDLALLEQLHQLSPPIPVVVHSFLSEEMNHLEIPGAAAFLEKEEDTAHLKEVVAEVIGKHYPLRFLSA